MTKRKRGRQPGAQIVRRDKLRRTISARVLPLTHRYLIDVGAGQEIDRLVRRSREFQTWLKTAGVVTVAPENSRIEEASE